MASEKELYAFDLSKFDTTLVGFDDPLLGFDDPLLGREAGQLDALANIAGKTLKAKASMDNNILVLQVSGVRSPLRFGFETRAQATAMAQVVKKYSGMQIHSLVAPRRDAQTIHLMPL